MFEELKFRVCELTDESATLDASDILFTGEWLPAALLGLGGRRVQHERSLWVPKRRDGVHVCTVLGGTIRTM